MNKTKFEKLLEDLRQPERPLYLRDEDVENLNNFIRIIVQLCEEKSVLYNVVSYDFLIEENDQDIIIDCALDTRRCKLDKKALKFLLYGYLACLSMNGCRSLLWSEDEMGWNITELFDYLVCNDDSSFDAFDELQKICRTKIKAKQNILIT